jgi:hypothetical protein
MKADSRVALPSASRFRSASHQPSANGSPVTVLCTYSTVINCTEDGVPPSLSPTIRLLNWLIESFAGRSIKIVGKAIAVQYSVYCTVRTVPRRSLIGHGITSSTEIAQQGQPVHCSLSTRGAKQLCPLTTQRPSTPVQYRVTVLLTNHLAPTTPIDRPPIDRRCPFVTILISHPQTTCSNSSLALAMELNKERRETAFVAIHSIGVCGADPRGAL